MSEEEFEFPNYCPFCGEMLWNIEEYLDHLFWHFPVAGFQYDKKKVEEIKKLRGEI